MQIPEIPDLNMQILEILAQAQVCWIPAQRKFVSEGCHAHKPPTCHAHSNTHKQPNPVVPSIFMQDKKF